nr:MFS transporter [Sporomusa silvacetica]
MFARVSPYWFSYRFCFAGWCSYLCRSFHSAAVAHMCEESPPEERGKNIGIYNSAFPFMAVFVAPIYATQIAALWGWQMACFLTIIPGVALAWFIKRSIKESKRFEAQCVKSEGSWTDILKEKNIWLCFIACGLWMVWCCSRTYSLLGVLPASYGGYSQ